MPYVPFATLSYSCGLSVGMYTAGGLIGSLELPISLLSLKVSRWSREQGLVHGTLHQVRDITFLRIICIPSAPWTLGFIALLLCPGNLFPPWKPPFVAGKIALTGICSPRDSTGAAQKIGYSLKKRCDIIKDHKNQSNGQIIWRCYWCVGYLRRWRSWFNQRRGRAGWGDWG